MTQPSDLTNISVDRQPDGMTRISISTLLEGGLIDFQLPPELTLMLTKLLVNSLAGAANGVPDDQKV